MVEERDFVDQRVREGHNEGATIMAWASNYAGRADPADIRVGRDGVQGILRL